MLRQLADEGRAVLAVLHDLNLATRYAHRMTVMASGRCVADDVPANALNREVLRSAFGLDAELVTHGEPPSYTVHVYGEAEGR